jgi:hypothetical protein
LAVPTTRARQRIDARHVSKFNVPTPSARLTEKVRLVDVKHRKQRIGTASGALLEEPSPLGGIAQFPGVTAKLIHRERRRA